MINPETSSALPAPEHHPLEPFLPENARLLMLGSFPPPKRRWVMDFYYPNRNNDMWRIVGYLFFGDKLHFVTPDGKGYRKACITDFLEEKGIALFDTATVVRRLAGNASDKFLEVVEPTDIIALLRKLPHCHAVVTTGEKATETFCSQMMLETKPAMGSSTPYDIGGCTGKLYRMPSSSRAYPLSIEKKAEAYKLLYSEIGML